MKQHGELQCLEKQMSGALENQRLNFEQMLKNQEFSSGQALIQLRVSFDQKLKAMEDKLTQVLHSKGIVLIYYLSALTHAYY
ncbi:unnamed protein product [Didymodactylos carnosus]|uniref:Uncharacterized protein n=1 Tax=Didymodactylos carnosus TaxID=1234261 RepID=A0A815YK90_9BILA|nr:unnamed protein product [Didymodactylos carnosus]CAF4436669.1 unnamed protein product [Didymodactylos carnosus]